MVLNYFRGGIAGSRPLHLPRHAPRTARRAGLPVILGVIAWFLLASPACAQTYIFESPNTREHMSDEAAIQSLDSPEQRNFIAVARYLAGRLCGHSEVEGGLGVFEGDTENTAMVSGCAKGRARYLGDLLARYAHQEWLLIFSADPEGSERLVVLRYATDEPLKTPAEMRRFGVKAGTALTGPGNRVRLYLWMADHAQDGAIRALAEAHHAQVEEIRGKGALVGNDSRAQAQRVFDREIDAYEKRSRWKLSALLRTRKLRDMGQPKRRTTHSLRSGQTPTLGHSVAEPQPKTN